MIKQAITTAAVLRSGGLQFPAVSCSRSSATVFNKLSVQQKTDMKMLLHLRDKISCTCAVQQLFMAGTANSLPKDTCLTNKQCLK